MVIREELDGRPMTISLTSRALTLSRDDDLIAAWDLGGRLYSVVKGPNTYRRGLNGRVLVKWRAGGSRQRRWASESEAAEILDLVASLARNSLRGARARTDEAAWALERAAAFTSGYAAADAARFGETYQPIGILPPDQYLALVLQATEGCSFRSCTFCDFYREPYRVKNADQFREHLAAVREYLGASLSLRDRAIFLGSANALAIPMSGLVPLFDIVAEQFPGRPVYAFLDAFTGAMKSSGDYAVLRSRGLRRVYIGVESGDDALLAFVGKPSRCHQAIEAVRATKAGGVSAGVIVMIGLGGTSFADAHARGTAEAINAMALGAGDFLYFSDLVALPGSPYLSAAGAAGNVPLYPDQRLAQRAAITSRLVFPSSAPRIATYDIREFVY